MDSDSYTFVLQESVTANKWTGWKWNQFPISPKIVSFFLKAVKEQLILLYYWNNNPQTVISNQNNVDR